jgi:hypothetical protein
MALFKVIVRTMIVLVVAVLLAYANDTWKDIQYFSKTGDLKVTAFEKAAKGFRR